MSFNKVEHSSLGKEVAYTSQYSPDLLFPVPRAKVWVDKGLAACPFQGYDIWNAYEMSWLNSKGLPQVAVGEFRVPAASANLIESKSFKLYLNSLNQHKPSLIILDLILGSTCSTKALRQHITCCKSATRRISN